MSDSPIILGPGEAASRTHDVARAIRRVSDEALLLRDSLSAYEPPKSIDLRVALLDAALKLAQADAELRRCLRVFECG